MNSRNRQAFLNMLAISEIGAKLLAKSDNGYNVLVGGKLFYSYADHPRIHVKLRQGLWSTAAGRYQILERMFDCYREELSLPDFSPASQDAIALQMITERSALPMIDAGNLRGAIEACSNIWASLPGNSYGQHENEYAALQADFISSGGQLA